MTSPFRILPVNDWAEAGVKALKSVLPVEEIWIFGSQATGNADPYLSDLDLLIVLSDNHGIAKPHRQAGIALARTPAPTGAEIIVMTRSQSHKQHAAKTPLLATEARTKGRKIYERK